MNICIRQQKNFWLFLLTLLLFSGCERASTSTSRNQPTAIAIKEEKISDYAKYNGPKNDIEIKSKYNEECNDKSCLISTSPELTPIVKSDNSPICISDSLSILFHIYLNREGNTIGAECRIGKDNYDGIVKQNKSINVYKEYANQRDIFEDFKTWKTDYGYLTTYREITVPDSRGNIIYAYNLYIGKEEHPYRSRFLK